MCAVLVGSWTIPEGIIKGRMRYEGRFYELSALFRGRRNGCAIRRFSGTVQSL